MTTKSGLWHTMNNPEKQNQPDCPKDPPAATDTKATAIPQKPTEHGGAKGLEPTRYGDWERNGRCTDF